MIHLRHVAPVCVGALSMALGVATAEAVQRAATSQSGEVTVTAASHGGEAILAAEAGGVRLERRVTTDGAGRISVSVGDADERVEIAMSADAVRVARDGIVRTLTARTLDAASVRDVRALLHDSRAVQAIASLQARLEAEGPTPLATAAAFVRMLAGDAAAMRRTSDRTAGAGPVVRLARQEAAACWSSYQNSMWIFFMDLESCISSNSWNLPVQYACSFNYWVQAEVAWFSLIACAGGLPAL